MAISLFVKDEEKNSNFSKALKIFRNTPAIIIFCLCLFLLTFFSTASLEAQNWRREQKREYFQGEEVYDYLKKGAELYFDYGFRELYVSYYSARSAGKRKELTLEVFRMASPEDAFGIFSVMRKGNEKVSEQIDALHWLSDNRVNILKGDFFINIKGSGTRLEELEKFAMPIPGRVLGETKFPPLLDLLPYENRIANSERYIKGRFAAAAESILLRRKFWSFDEGARAVSARYSPSNAKVIVIDFGEKKIPLQGYVRELFSEYMEYVDISENTVEGSTDLTYYFLYEQKGEMGVLVLGEKGVEKAYALLDAVLEKIKD
ncbi:MAG: DUF6599 family protein [Candidatus Aminicenantales bacterium]